MTLRVGILGFGVMGRNHASVLADLDGVELVAVADTADHQAAGLPHGKVCANLKELLSEGIEACVVATPTANHFDAGLALAEAGVHCMIEKPLTSCPDEARILIDAFSSRGLVACVGYVERFNPAIIELRHNIERGALGTVHSIRTIRQSGFSLRTAAVGVIEDLATHDLDTAQWIGQAGFRDLDVTADALRDPAYEDLAAIAGRLENGVVVSHYVDRISPMRRRITEVSGSLGLAIADALSPSLTLYLVANIDSAPDRENGEIRVVKPQLLTSQPLRLELQALRDAILGGSHAADIVPLAEALRTVECVVKLQAQLPYRRPTREDVS